MQRPIRIKLCANDVKKLLTGEVVSVKDVMGQEVQIIASDDGVDVYQKACDKALQEVREKMEPS